MRQLIYFSHAVGPFSKAALFALLEKSREKNAARGITGMLLHSGENFVQVIEGSDEAVGALYAEIERDPRHAGILTAVDHSVTNRSFPDWSMGFRHLVPESGELPAGFSRYLSEPSADRDPERLRDVALIFLEAFRDNAR